MQPTVGEIFEGKVTGITKFGAFISLPDGSNGLVHISEIANNYVNDVHDHVTEGQTVKVKVIGLNEAGKINLSIKKAEPPPPRTENERPPQPRAAAPRPKDFSPKPYAQRSFNQSPPTEPSFEDKIKQFMQDSDSRISDSRMYTDKKAGYRRKRD